MLSFVIKIQFLDGGFIFPAKLIKVSPHFAAQTVVFHLASQSPYRRLSEWGECLSSRASRLKPASVGMNPQTKSPPGDIDSCQQRPLSMC